MIDLFLMAFDSLFVGPRKANEIRKRQRTLREQVRADAACRLHNQSVIIRNGGRNSGRSWLSGI